MEAVFFSINKNSSFFKLSTSKTCHKSGKLCTSLINYLPKRFEKIQKKNTNIPRVDNEIFFLQTGIVN